MIAQYEQHLSGLEVRNIKVGASEERRNSDRSKTPKIQINRYYRFKSISKIPIPVLMFLMDKAFQRGLDIVSKIHLPKSLSNYHLLVKYILLANGTLLDHNISNPHWKALSIKNMSNPT